MVDHGIGPALPARSRNASGSPVPDGPWSRKTHSGWKPKPCLNVGAAGSFSLWAVTRAASMSITSGRPASVSRSGACSPANAQAAARAVAHAEAICGQCGRGISGQTVDQPGDRGIGGDRSEHLRRSTQLRHIGQTVPTDRQAHRQIQQDLARIMPGQWSPPKRRRTGESGAQADGMHSAQQQHRPGVRHDTRALPVHCQSRKWPGRLRHQKGAPVSAKSRPWTSHIFPAQEHVSYCPAPTSGPGAKAPG